MQVLKTHVDNKTDKALNLKKKKTFPADVAIKRLDREN
jgi:hypothetical protein